MRVAVTGATGQVGGELVRFLQKAAIPNRLLVRNPNKALSFQDQVSEIALFDFNRPETYAKALEGVDKLFLVADTYTQEPVIRAFLQAAQNEVVQKVIVMSGIGADKVKTHFLAKLEAIVEKSKIPYIALRANWFFQNFGSCFREMISERRMLTFPDARASISLVDARDVAEVAFNLMTNKFETSAKGLDITGPESLTHEIVAQLLSKYLPYRVGYLEISENEAREKLSWNDDWLSLFKDIRNGITASVSPAVKEILRKPARCLEDYIQENISLWL